MGSELVLDSNFGNVFYKHSVRVFHLGQGRRLNRHAFSIKIKACLSSVGIINIKYCCNVI